MKYLLIFIVILCSCKNTKEVFSNKSETKDTLSVYQKDSSEYVLLDSDGDGVLDEKDDCPFQFGLDTNGCPELSMMVIDNGENKDLSKLTEKEVIVKIKKHENKTKLKTFDYSTKDTTKGWIAYSVPEQMQTLKPYSIKVRISKKTNQNKATLILGDRYAINDPNLPSVATIEDIQISGDMTAELVSDKESFKIELLSSPTQSIDSNTFTEWEWIVTPLTSGERSLKLVIKMKNSNKDIVVFNKNIVIKKNVSVAVESFFEKYWQWFMTTIIIPIFVYFWNKKKKNKKR